MSILITDFGAKPDGSLCTAAMQAAIDHAARQGGGCVVVPAGRFYTSSIVLRDHINLHLEAGATLRFSDRQEDYPVVASRWEGVSRDTYSSCIFAQDAVNVSVTGFGVIDGNGKLWWDIMRNRRDELKYPRPRLISFDRCKDVTIRDVTLIDSPSWTVNPIRCENVTVDHVTIKNPADSPNTDGVDPDSCKNVRITGCHIDVGDDCIAIKAGKEQDPERIPCENITINGCTMVHGHGGIVLGSEMSGDIRNVVVSNCVFQETDRGIRFKSRRGRGGVVEDVRVSNVVMQSVLCPFVVNLYYYGGGAQGKDKYVWDKAPYPVTGETPSFRRFHFSDITARDVRAAAGFIYGLAECYASDMTFDNIHIHMAEDAVPGYPAMMSGLEEMKQRGFYIGFARDIAFRNVSIENHEDSAFYLENTDRVEIEGCRSLCPRQEGLPLVREK